MADLRRRKLHVLFKVVIYCAVSAIFSSKAIAAPKPDPGSGGFGDLMQFIVDAPRIDDRLLFSYNLMIDNQQHHLEFDIFRSRLHLIGVYDNKCVAVPPNKIICDLNLVKALVRDFRLAEYESERSKDPNFINYLENSMLRWIIAHEIGHIVQKHPSSAFAPEIRGFLVYDNAQQKLELEADAFAVKIIISSAPDTSGAYGFVLTVVNALIAANLCPGKKLICNKLNPGVGIIYNNASRDPIRIAAGGKHPDFIARFLRIVFLAAKAESSEGFQTLAQGAINKLSILDRDGRWKTVKDTFDKSDRRP